MSGQTQPETALQALAEKLRTDAIAIFGEGQAERDIIEWFYGALLAAAPATPAAQGAVPDVSAMARVLSDRAASACCVDPDDNWKIYGQEYIEDVRAMLAHPTQQGEAVEVVEVRGLQWLDSGHYRKKPPQFGYNPHDWNPLMTVAQHQRIMAASVPAGCKAVPVDLIERTICRLTHGHEHDKAVRELRALLAGTGQEVS